ncbi:MAG: anthranilate phosphoribosyltransferase [Deltaproteobacteria bacterium]|nr:MAG: anthranilate phosphoribosyltransferase [Deltaproteobacteria bacterium]
MTQDAARTVAAALDTLAARNLSRVETRTLFGSIIAGELAEVEIAALLGAFKARGETPDEIAGAAEALREAATPFPRPDYPFADTCGTGGDGVGSLNISTAVAILSAEMGIPVAKHGNRSVSSKCGSADVLEQLGVRLDAPPAVSRACLDETGLCFLFAPQYHPGVRHAMPVRRALRTRTLFNLLGPLANPATPPIQLMGVYDPALVRPIAHTLGKLGCSAALVVHGAGMDEIALHDVTTAAIWRDGSVAELELTPEEAGVHRRPIDALAGGAPEDNARWLRAALAGQAPVAHLEAIAINAGALAWIAGLAEDLGSGTTLALETLAGGGAAERLARWAEASQAPEPERPDGA